MGKRQSHPLTEKHAFKLESAGSAPRPVYGYVEGDYPVELNSPDKGLVIMPRVKNERRDPVAFIGKFCIVDLSSSLDASFLWPDTQSAANQVTASIHRFGCEMPKPKTQIKDEFVIFARNLLKFVLDPLTPDELLTNEEWLAGAPYSERRKEQLRRLRLNGDALTVMATRVKSFIKNECYAKAKAARAINSPDDITKAFLGALIASIDRKTFSLPFFVKGTNPRDWPEKLKELFGPNPVCETDFTSFEAHHHSFFAEIVNDWLQYMCRDVADAATKRLISFMVTGINDIVFKHLSVKILGRLMSGSMWTSSGNGFLNFNIVSFLTLKAKYPELPPDVLATKVFEVRALFEGDDGIFEDVGQSEDMAAELGLKLKFDRVGFYGDASFCGIVCSPECDNVVTDPLKILCKISFLDKKYINAREGVQLGLLRARAMSYLTCFSDTPVVGVLCKHICDLTRGKDHKDFVQSLSWFEQNLLSTCDAKPWTRVGSLQLSPGHPARALIAERFGLPIPLQLDMENRILRGGWTARIDFAGLLTQDQLDFAANYIGKPPTRLPCHSDVVAKILVDGLHCDNMAEWYRKLPKNATLKSVEPRITIR